MSSTDNEYTWVRLATGNDWGTIYYAPNDKVLVGGCADRSRGVILGARDQYHFRLGDGSIRRGRLVKSVHQSQVCDHGKTYNVEQVYWFAEFELNKTRVSVPLTSIDIRLSTIELRNETT